MHVQPAVLLPPDRVLSPAEAQAMQDRGEVATWVVMCCDPRHPGGLVARPYTRQHGSVRPLACVLVSATLANLRAWLPAGVSRRGELAYLVPADTVEIWD